MKSQINIRASALTQRQLAELTAHLGTSITETITLAVNNLYQQETRNMNSNLIAGSDSYYTRFVGNAFPTEEFMDGFNSVEDAVDAHIEGMKSVSEDWRNASQEEIEDIRAGLIREIEHELETGNSV